jgi:hypothetical protein
MKVTGQLHALATSHSGKEAPVPIEQKADWAQKKQSLAPTTNQNPNCTSHGPVARAPMLSQLLNKIDFKVTSNGISIRTTFTDHQGQKPHK